VPSRTALGDTLTRLDRNETGLNSAIAGDPRDTTTPLAMLGNLQALLLGDALPRTPAARLEGWLRANQTGGRAPARGLPKDWQVGDKTGSGRTARPTTSPSCGPRDESRCWWPRT
jgi:beta-lactamase class A